MDFRPTRNTLVANYVITFAVVGLILYLSLRPGKVVQYYYSPEFTSHAGYGGTNCASCHSNAWGNVTDKNCSTAGCHTEFTPGKAATPGRLAMTKDEFGNARPNFGPILAFHDKVMGQTSCEICHPSHRLPQKGAFNHETILVAMQQTGGIPADKAAEAKKRADLFHRGAEQFAGKMSCQECHVGMTGDTIANPAASTALQQMSATVTPPPDAVATPVAAAPVDTPALPPLSAPQYPPPAPAVSTGVASTSGGIVSGDLLNMPALGSPTPGTSPAATPTETPLPNLFETVDQVKPTPATAPQDSAVQMPN